MLPNRKIFIGVIALAAALFFLGSTVVYAAPKLSINSVQVDLGSDTITITGVGFDTVNDTIVTLGVFGSLGIQSETSTTIVATLPPTITPGNYLLTVLVTKGSAQSDEFDLTVVDITDSDTLAGLGCTSDQIARFNGSNWVCQDIPVDTDTTLNQAGVEALGFVTGAHTVDSNAETKCATGQVLDGNGICRDLNALLDRLGALEELVPRIVFVTSGHFPGDLDLTGGSMDGLEGGDNICQNAADTLNSVVPPGTYRAWLSTSAVNAKDRIGPHFGPFVRPDGTVIANSLQDLIDGSLDDTINLNEAGMDMGSVDVWTGTLDTGLTAFDNCANWTNGTDLEIGVVGSTVQTSSVWTGLAPSLNMCGSNTAHLYCFQELGGF